MAFPRSNAGLIPLSECVSQPYFSNRIQLADLIEWVLSQTGPAEIIISTFSTGEEFLRRMDRLKQSGIVRSCSMFCDLRAARKTVALYQFIKSVFDAVYLCENHSKVVLISNDAWNVAIVTSQNQTRGDRYEAGIISTDVYSFNFLSQCFKSLISNSVSLDDVKQRSN